MRSIVKYASIAVLTLVVLSTLVMIPVVKVASAETIVVNKITSTRDAWGTFYDNMTIRFDIQLDITSDIPGATMRVILVYTPSGGSSTYYVVNASRLGTTLTYQVYFKVSKGELKVWNGTTYVSLSPKVTLSEGDTVALVAYGKQDSLTYTHKAASVTGAPTEILESATTLNLTEWKVVAPDLITDPEKIVVYGSTNSSIQFRIYKEGTTTPVVSGTAFVKESDKNTGEFVITDVSSPFRTGLGTVNISSLSLSAGDVLVVNFTIPKCFGGDVEYYAVKLSVVKVPTVTITTDRAEVPLSAYAKAHVDVKVTIVDKSVNRPSVTIDVTVYNRSGIAACIPGLFRGNTSGTGCTATFTLNKVDTSTYEGWIQINTSKLTSPGFINGWVLLNYSGTTKKLYLKVYSASLSVNATSVKYGDVVEITVVDPEMNLNASNKDTLNVSVSGATQTYITLTETGENTGKFVADVVIGRNITGVNPGDSFKISYTDERSPRTPGSAASFLSDTYSAEITIKSFVGSVSTSKKVYGPYEDVKIIITDPDANVNPAAKDTIPANKILIVVAGNQFHPTTGATETGKNTGVFELTITPDDLYKLATGNTTVTDRIKMVQYLLKAGDIIVMYEDDYTPEGPKLLQTTFKFESYDAKLLVDKTAYNIGDKINITVVDPDANTDSKTIQSITVTIKSTTWPVGTSVTLYETGEDTGVFTGTVAISDSQVAPGYIYAKYGDEITISYTDPLPADYATTGKSKTFTKVVHVGVTVEKPIKPQSVSFVSPTTGESVAPKVGKMVLVQVPLTNTAPYDVTFTAIMVVRDSSGAAVYIAATSIPLGAGKTGSVSFGWIPTAEGKYTIEVMILQSLAQWTPLGESITTTVTVSS